MKRFFAMFLSIITIFALTTGAYAMDDIDEPTQYTTVLQYPVGRSTSLPSGGMKLDSEDASYYADIVELGNKWLYTNKYFYQTATIVCDFSIGYKAENSFVIGCYDMTAKTWLSDQETFDMPHSLNEPTYLTGAHAFTGLNPSHHYAVAFKCNNVGKYTYLTGNCNITNWDGYIAGLE